MAIISEADDQVARVLTDCLRERGIQAHCADRIDPSSTTAVIYLRGLATIADDQAAIDICQDAFTTARAFAAYATEYGGAFVTVQDTGGDFGLRGSDRALLGGLAGLAKTADLEWPLSSVKAIDIERGDRSAVDVAVALVDELLLGGPQIEVGLRADGQRTTLQSQLSAVSPGTLPPMSVLVCSGGARGVTASTLIALAQRCENAPKIALLGRTTLEDEPADCVGIDGEANLKRALMLAAKAKGQPVKPSEIGAQVHRIIARREIRATLTALQAAGSEANYYATDVSDSQSVRNSLAIVRREWGPISAIIHGAGVVADKNIADKTDEQFHRVMGPKVNGLRALLDATQDDPIKVLVMFSSVAARTGNVGQCDYAMANEILNKIAAREQLRRPECMVKSLNWGPWEGGMVTPSLKTYFESHGVPLIPLETGAAMLVDELASGDANIEIVLGGEPRRASIAGDTEAQSVLIHVDATTHPHLVDHVIDDTVVLPLVEVLEWFTRAAEALYPGKLVTSCQQVRVLRGVPLKHFYTSGDRLLLQCGPMTNGSVHLALCDVGDPRKRYYAAELTLADDLPTAPAKPIPDLATSAPPSPIYGGTLFHGPQFQVIRAIESVCDEGVAGTLDTTASIGWPGQWRTDPAALDGGLQLALLWAKHCLGGPSLPTGLGSYQRFDIAPTGPLQCTLTGKIDGSSRALSDITFRDANGQVVAQLKDVETHQRP